MTREQIVVFLSINGNPGLLRYIQGKTKIRIGIPISTICDMLLKPVKIGNFGSVLQSRGNIVALVRYSEHVRSKMYGIG